MKRFFLPIKFGFLFGIISLLIGTMYGAKYGCFTTFFGMQGYEACGNIFAITGIIAGIILGIFKLKK